jgi:hypothetical protein
VRLQGLCLAQVVAVTDGRERFGGIDGQGIKARGSEGRRIIRGHGSLAERFAVLPDWLNGKPVPPVSTRDREFRRNWWARTWSASSSKTPTGPT